MQRLLCERQKKLMNRFVEIFVIETRTRACEEKNTKNAVLPQEFDKNAKTNTLQRNRI